MQKMPQQDTWPFPSSSPSRLVLPPFGYVEDEEQRLPDIHLIPLHTMLRQLTSEGNINSKESRRYHNDEATQHFENERSNNSSSSSEKQLNQGNNEVVESQGQNKVLMDPLLMTRPVFHGETMHVWSASHVRYADLH